MAAPDVFSKDTLTSNMKWKGQVFRQICAGIKFNANTYSKQVPIAPRLLRKALPLKIYRREIANVATKCNPRTSMLYQFDNPGSTVVTQYTTSNGLVTTLDMNYDKNTCEHPATRNSSTTTCAASLSIQKNALRRVRSSGMIPRKFNTNANNDMYYTDTQQYLKSRNMTFQQNQYFHIQQGNALAKPGTKDAMNNVYAANSLNHCKNSKVTYVPIYYKPNNSKFGQQGAVSSSSLIARKRYNTITTAADAFRTAYGKQTADALAYGVPEYGYTLKDRVGFDKIKTPVISPYSKKLKSCITLRSIRNMRNG